MLIILTPLLGVGLAHLRKPKRGGLHNVGRRSVPTVFGLNYLIEIS